MADSSQMQKGTTGGKKTEQIRQKPPPDNTEKEPKDRKRGLLIAFWLGLILGLMLGAIFFKAIGSFLLSGLVAIMMLGLVLGSFWVFAISLQKRSASQINLIFSAAMSLLLVGLVFFGLLFLLDQAGLLVIIFPPEVTLPKVVVSQSVDMSVEVSSFHKFPEPGEPTLPPVCVSARPPDFRMGLIQAMDRRYTLEGHVTAGESQLVSLELSDFPNANLAAPIQFSEFPDLDDGWADQTGVYVYDLSDTLGDFSFVIAQERIGEEFRATVTITDECENYTRIDPVVKAE